MVQEHVGEEAVHPTVDRKCRKRRRPGIRYDLQRHSSSDLLPPTRTHLLAFSKLPKYHHPLGAKCSTHELVGDISHLNHNTMS
jgi:hypothetical protein